MEFLKLNFDLIIIAVMSIAAFAMIAVDKWRDETDRRPLIHTALILLPAIAGGAFGSLCGMILLNRKISDSTFMIAIPVLAIVEVGLSAIWRTGFIF